MKAEIEKHGWEKTIHYFRRHLMLLQREIVQTEERNSVARFLEWCVVLCLQGDGNGIHLDGCFCGPAHIAPVVGGWESAGGDDERQVSYL